MGLLGGFLTKHQIVPPTCTDPVTVSKVCAPVTVHIRHITIQGDLMKKISQVTDVYISLDVPTVVEMKLKRDESSDFC